MLIKRKRVGASNDDDISTRIYKVYDPNDVKKVEAMSLEDFSIYVGSPTKFTVKKRIVIEKYTSILLSNLKIPDNEPPKTTIDRFHIIVILMTLLARRLGKSPISFHYDHHLKETIDGLFNTMLHIFVTIIGERMILSDSDKCPYCSNTYRDCLSTISDLAEFVVFSEVNIKQIISIVKWAPKYRTSGMVYEKKEGEEDEEEEEEEDESAENEEVHKEFEFVFEEYGTYSFL